MEHARVVFAPVLQLREGNGAREAVGDVAQVLEQVLELAELANRGLHRDLPVLLAVVHHRVAHGGEDRPPLAGVGGERVLHAPLVGLDLRHRAGERPGEDVALLLHREVVGVRRAGRDPDRRMGLLQRLRHRGRGRKRPEFALVGVVALPERLHHGQHLEHVLECVVALQAGVHAVELALVSAGADAELEPPAAVKVQQRSLARRLDRVPVGRDHHRRAEPDAGRVGGPPSEDLERVGRDGHLQRVVLGGPGDGEAALVRHLHHLQRVALDIGHVEVGRETLHVDGKLEFHGSRPPERVAGRRAPGWIADPRKLFTTLLVCPLPRDTVEADASTLRRPQPSIIIMSCIC